MNTTLNPDVLDHVVPAQKPQPPTAEISSAEPQHTPSETSQTVQTKSRHRPASVRRLLHALVQAGQPTGSNAMQPLVGPNGALLWTDISRDEVSRADSHHDGAE